VAHGGGPAIRAATYGGWPIFVHCLPFDAQRCWDRTVSEPSWSTNEAWLDPGTPHPWPAWWNLRHAAPAAFGNQGIGVDLVR
jgi:hypothetical protein